MNTKLYQTFAKINEHVKHMHNAKMLTNFAVDNTVYNYSFIAFLHKIGFVSKFVKSDDSKKIIITFTVNADGVPICFKIKKFKGPLHKEIYSHSELQKYFGNYCHILMITTVHGFVPQHTAIELGVGGRIFCDIVLL
jgi:ribosomal protein S8